MIHFIKTNNKNRISNWRFRRFSKECFSLSGEIFSILHFKVFHSKNYFSRI